MAWCADNLRDCQAWLDEGLHMSTVSSEASRLFDATLRQYVTWIECDQLGGIEKTSVDMLKADPDFVLGKALSYGVDLIGTGRTTRLDKQFAKEIDDLVAEVHVNNNVTPREKLHVKAVKQFADGFVNDACVTWEEILRQHPNDMLALKLAHDSYFYMGNSAEIRDSIARVLPKWKKEDPLYSWLHGMIAFGYEENNQFELAENAAKQALSLQKQDAWATHALSHVYEMTVRYPQGIRLMSDTVKDWEPCNMLACHNFWHWAVYHIEKKEYDVALGIYDRECAKRVQSSALLDIVDATSLLYRLELEGVNVRDRWEPLYAICERHLDEHILTFNDVMMRMAVLGHDRAEDAKRIHQSMLDYIEEAKGDNVAICKKWGVPLCKALDAYNSSDFSTASEHILAAHNGLSTIGGSNAQRDVFDQLLIRCCMQSPEKKHVDAGRKFLLERQKNRPNAPLTDRLVANFKQIHGSL